MSIESPHIVSDGNSPIIINNNRIVLLDVAKGLAILLVVLGHLTGSEIKSVGNEWYEIVNTYLYKFHMAFFFFISGLIYFYKSRLPASLSDYWFNINKRFWRVAPAYFLLAMFVYFTKLFSQDLFAVDRKVGFSIAEVSKLITYPTQSFASFLWFIFVLLLIEALVPLLFLVSRNNKYVALSIAFVCFFIPASKFLALHQVSHYLFFFVLAVFFVGNIQNLFDTAQKWLIVSLLLFSSSIIFLPFSSLNFFLGIFGLFVLAGISKSIPSQLLSFLTLLGRFTFSIYLFNTICIGAVKAGLFKITNWNGNNFFFFLPLLMFAGLFVPILIKKYFLSRIPWLDGITN